MSARRLPGLLLTLAAVIGVATVEAAPATPLTVEDATAQHERAAALRGEAERRRKEEEALCYGKILVNDCLAGAKARYLEQIVVSRQLDSAAREAEREAKRRELADEEAQRARRRAQREAEAPAQAEAARAEVAAQTAARERKLAEKARQAEAGQRKTAAEQARRQARLERRARKNAAREARREAGE